MEVVNNNFHVQMGRMPEPYAAAPPPSGNSNSGNLANYVEGAPVTAGERGGRQDRFQSKRGLHDHDEDDTRDMITMEPLKLVQKVLNENAADQVLDVDRLLLHVSNACERGQRLSLTLILTLGEFFNTKLFWALLFVGQFLLNIVFVSYNFYESPKPGNAANGLYSCFKDEREVYLNVTYAEQKAACAALGAGYNFSYDYHKTIKFMLRSYEFGVVLLAIFTIFFSPAMHLLGRSMASCYKTMGDSAHLAMSFSAFKVMGELKGGDKLKVMFHNAFSTLHEWLRHLTCRCRRNRAMSKKNDDYDNSAEDDDDEMPPLMKIIFKVVGYPALAIGEVFFIVLVPIFVVCVLASVPLAPVAVYIKIKDLAVLFGNGEGVHNWIQTDDGRMNLFLFLGFLNQLANLADVINRQKDAIIRFVFGGADAAYQAQEYHAITAFWHLYIKELVTSHGIIGGILVYCVTYSSDLQKMFLSKRATTAGVGERV